MNLGQALILGIVQGITEFLPISSSGHLVVMESWLKLPVSELQSFDVAVHFGTLLAIVMYFWKDIWGLVVAGLKFVAKKEVSVAEQASQRMVGYIILGTIPAVVVGLFLQDFLKEYFRHSHSVAIMLVLGAILFVVAEQVKQRVKTGELVLKSTFVIGLAQAVALIPGVSRSGVTIAAGLLQGIEREHAARFSFLLGSVAITAATALSVYQVAQGTMPLPGIDVLMVGVLSSFVSGYAAVFFLMKFLKTHTLYAFAAYRVILAMIIGLSLLI